MNKALVVAVIILGLATAAYAQSPWGEWMRSSQDVKGLAGRVTVLEAENDDLKDALLALLYDKRLKLAANLTGATLLALDENGDSTGWGVYIYDPTSPEGEAFVLGTVHMVTLKALIVDNDTLIVSLE